MPLRVLPLVAAAVVASLAGGCRPSAVTPAARVTPPVAAPAVAVTLGLPYQPDVQFTPLYMAKDSGQFSKRDVDVSFQYGDESQFVRLVGAGQLDACIASGEQVILARADGIPVTYVLAWYQQFPGVVFSLDPALDAPLALVGHRIGLPAPSGASYIGWQALLAANHVDPTRVTTEIIGYDQLAAVLEGRVDAAVGYAANEPVQLRAEGKAVTVIDIADSFNLVSNGLVVSQSMIASHPDEVQALVSAIAAGIKDSLTDPDRAFETALAYVPEAADSAVRARQRAVLDASMPYWKAATIGRIDAQSWSDSQSFLMSIGLVKIAAPLSELIDDRFVTAADTAYP
jgi:NitT/TauT family transport system substrate-binding protein